MRRLAARAIAVAVGSAALLLAAAQGASAHPLGNFTVNRYSGLVVAADGVTVDHVLDLAEIPTAQRSPSIDTDGDGDLGKAELDRWATGQCAGAQDTLRLDVAGEHRPMTVTRSSAGTAPGQAGLPVLRLECRLHADLPLSGSTQLRFVDSAAGDQVGWREVTARFDGVTATDTDVPRQSTSHRLTTYPKDLLSSPLDVRGADLTVRPGGARLAAGAEETAGVATVAGGATGAFQDLAARYDGSLLVAVVALLAALVLGAGHAIAPGHGKTIMAFYLSGRQDGALRAATTVGATVTVTHTAGVLALGVLVSAGTAFVPARVYPWLTLLSGALVVAVGLTLLRASRRGGHVHGPRGHTHVPSHDHAHDNHHDHAAEGTLLTRTVVEHDHEHAPATTQRGLVAIGLAGGLLPSPSAVLVFLGALAVGHPWFGVLLVVAFGLGMATTLAVVGVLVMRLRERVEQRLQRRPGTRTGALLAALPVLTAGTVIVLGTLLALKGLSSIGG